MRTRLRTTANKPRCAHVGSGNYNASIKNNHFLVHAIFFHLLSKLPPPYDTNLLLRHLSFRRRFKWKSSFTLTKQPTVSFFLYRHLTPRRLESSAAIWQLMFVMPKRHIRISWVTPQFCLTLRRKTDCNNTG